MNDYRKIFLLIALVFLSLTLYNKWQTEHPIAQAEIISQPQNQIASNSALNHQIVPNVPAAKQQSNGVQKNQQPSTTIAHGKLIWVKTDTLNIAIDSLGGNIVDAQLIKYPAELNSKTPFQLFTNDSNNYYVAQSGITGKQGPDTSKGQVTYHAQQSHYTLANNQKQLTVNLTYTKNGVEFIKQFIFQRGKYVIQQQYQIKNNSSKVWQGNFYTQLLRAKVEQHNSLVNHFAFTGAAFSSPSNHYKKLSFDDMRDQNYQSTNPDGWLAMVQHYFISAWVPAAADSFQYYSKVSGNIYTIGAVSSTITAKPKQTVKTSAQLYVGPAIGSRLDAVAPHLSLTIDYGWLWFISIALFWVLKHVYDFLGNWGWAIVVVTIFIKIAFYWLSAKSYRSMAHMRRLQPKMELIRERYAGDKPAQSKAMMELYRKEKCNPLSGCLPMVIQIPFFIAFYYMISASVELRQAPFMLWIHDLSIPDPYYILPVIMGASMFLQQRLNPPAPDPMQQKVMMFLPVIFTFFFLHFPAGLVLYWITNNVFSIAQQWLITRQVEQQENKSRGHNKQR
jgi:YidC/Oxa1 family membrane protein insertase